jgi:hypothetical protein
LDDSLALPKFSGSVPAGLDIPAQTAFRRNVLDVTHRKPHFPRVDPGGQGLVCGPAANPGKHQRAA